MSNSYARLYFYTFRLIFLFVPAQFAIIQGEENQMFPSLQKKD